MKEAERILKKTLKAENVIKFQGVKSQAFFRIFMEEPKKEAEKKKEE